MKRVEDIVVGDLVGVMDELIKTSEVEVVDVKCSDLTIKHGSLGLGVVDYSSVTHINGQPVVSSLEAASAIFGDAYCSGLAIMHEQSADAGGFADRCLMIPPTSGEIEITLTEDQNSAAQAILGMLEDGVIERAELEARAVNELLDAMNSQRDPDVTAAWIIKKMEQAK